MYTFILVLLIIDSLILVAAVLMQAAKGGGLAATFGGASSSSDSFVGTRQAANLLTKTSWWTGGIFIALSFMLQLMGQRSTAPKSVLDEPFSQPPAQTAPATPSTSTPAVPLTPVPPTQQQAPAKTPTNQPKP
jgi:preprotein translocase subunit SecG